MGTGISAVTLKLRIKTDSEKAVIIIQDFLAQ